MTDKVQKIREEVEKRYEYWREKESNSHSIESEIRMSECQHLSLMLDSLQEEPTSEDLEEAADNYVKSTLVGSLYLKKSAFKAGAEWQKEHLLKSVDDDLPEIDREVIALLENGKVVFAHRPPEYWDGKNIITNKVTRYKPKRYDKGGWNQPNVKWWIDLELSKTEK